MAALKKYPDVMNLKLLPIIIVYLILSNPLSINTTMHMIKREQNKDNFQLKNLIDIEINNQHRSCKHFNQKHIHLDMLNKSNNSKVKISVVIILRNLMLFLIFNGFLQENIQSRSHMKDQLINQKLRNKKRQL